MGEKSEKISIQPLTTSISQILFHLTSCKSFTPKTSLIISINKLESDPNRKDQERKPKENHPSVLILSLKKKKKKQHHQHQPKAVTVQKNLHRSLRNPRQLGLKSTLRGKWRNTKTNSSYWWTEPHIWLPSSNGAHNECLDKHGISRPHTHHWIPKPKLPSPNPKPDDVISISPAGNYHHNSAPASPPRLLPLEATETPTPSKPQPLPKQTPSLPEKRWTTH